MAGRPILRWPDPRLKQPAEDVGEITDDIKLGKIDIIGMRRVKVNMNDLWPLGMH